MVDERAEGARPDVLAADQAQPVEPLGVGEARTARVDPAAPACVPSALGADAVFAALAQPRDVLAVLPPQDRGQHGKTQRPRAVAHGQQAASGEAALATSADSEE